MDLLPLEMFMALLCVWQLQMGWERNKSNRTKTILALAALVVAVAAIFVTLYVNSPSGFIIKVYPDTQIDVCLENESLILEQNSGIVPGYSWADPSRGGLFIKDLTLRFDKDSIGFEENVSITDLDGPWWALGHVLKPYRKQVTLVIESGLSGVKTAFANDSFGGEIREGSMVTNVPPFKAKIILKIARNATLTPGPHYITIKGIGQNGEIEKCDCVLMVNKLCKNGPIAINYR